MEAIDCLYLKGSAREAPQVTDTVRSLLVLDSSCFSRGFGMSSDAQVLLAGGAK